MNPFDLGQHLQGCDGGIGRKIGRFTALGFALFVVCGCEIAPKNTENQVFVADCQNQTCTLSLPAEDAAIPYEISSSSRVLTACPAAATNATSDPAFDCRPIVCDSNRECTTLGGSEFSCTRGICQAPARPLSGPDMMSLCLAGTGPFSRAPAQLERVSVARAGARQNQIPAICRQP